MLNLQARYVHALLCDDVRIERGQKLSLMGVPSPILWLDGAAPYRLEGWQVAIWAGVPANDQFHSIVLRIEGSALDEAAEPLDLMDAFPQPKQEDKLGEQSLDEKSPPDDREIKEDHFGYFAAIELPILTITKEGHVDIIIQTERETFLVWRTPVRFRHPSP